MYKLQRYFDFDVSRDDCLKKGLGNICAERYSDSKYKVKRDYFTRKGGIDNIREIRQQPPPGMDISEWNALVDYYTQEQHIHQSQVNRANRRQQAYPSLHGAKWYVEIRDDRVTYFFSISIYLQYIN